MGGPAMIEGGGLGVFPPDEIGPIDVQVRSGVVDIAVAATRPRPLPPPSTTCRSSRAGSPTWDYADQRTLRNVVPDNRLRTYEIRNVIDRPRRHRFASSSCGAGSASAWSRRSSASRADRSASSPTTPTTSPGAIDSDGSDKAARFMQLCDAFDIPILVLCDTPGMMVGPEIEKTGARAPLQPAVRHRRQPVGARCS